MSNQRSFEEVVAIMHRLRAPGGCPWDAEQDHSSLRPYLIEEAYEVLDALDRDNDEDLCDELGDVLLQVLFHAELAAERSAFTIEDVVAGIGDKLVRRHPHVFADATVGDAADVERNWLRIKAEERAEKQSQDDSGEHESALDGIPTALPALARAHRLGQRASTIGLDWTEAASVRAKVQEELAELDEAVACADEYTIGHEIGDVLFAVVSYARHLGHNAETCLQQGLARFDVRVRQVEAEFTERGADPRDANSAALDDAWKRAKAATTRG